MSSAKKVCIAGPLTPPDDGTVIPTKVFLQRLFKLLPDDHNVRLVNTYTGDKSETGLLKLSVLLALMKVLATIIFYGARSDLVIIFGSQRFIATLGATCAYILSFLGKSVQVRIYGGAFDEYLASLSTTQKSITLKLMNKYDKIIVETELVKRNLISCFGERLAIAPNYRNRPARQFERHFDQSEITLFYCGIIRREKGFRELVEAFRALRTHAGNKRMRLLAAGRVHSDIREFVQDEGLLEDDDIEFLGQCSEEQVVDALCDSDILVLPTYWPTEGHSGTLIEGLMLGIPIVTTRWRANEEVIQDGVTGILCEPKNAADLAEKLKVLIDDPGVRQSLSTNAINSSNEFSSEKVCESLARQFGLIDDQTLATSGS